jgi:pentatricopeptide repeat protein
MTVKEMALYSRDLLGTYKALMELIPQGRRDPMLWESIPVFKILQSMILRVLDRITEDQGKTPGLPTPLDFLGEIKATGMNVRRLYTHILQALLVRQAPVEELLPVFDSAVSYRIPVESPEDIEPEDVEWIFCSFNKMLYITYIYLSDLGASSPILTVLDRHVTHCEVPSAAQVRGAMRMVRGASPELVAHITEISINFKLRHTLKVMTRLRSALDRFSQTNDLRGLEKFYNSAKALDPSPLNEAIFTCFISAFLSFYRSQDMALHVWDDMVNMGITPGVTSWNALLRYGHGYDRAALMTIWDRMILAGIMPDVHCWTTRIHSQMNANQMQDGLDSLREMVEMGTKPTTETINAAIDGLLKFDHFEESGQVIRWADELGVQADIITYNTLLRGYLKKHGAAHDAMSILKSMTDTGITPDVYTFTIVLDGIYKAAEAQVRPPPDLQEIAEVFEFMEGLGIQANVTTYTALVGGLLEENNMAAVHGVRQTMSEKEVGANVDFYTVLLKNAFQHLDLARVEDIIAEMHYYDVARDHVFWTEVILGYARAGLMEKMMAAMEKMKGETQRMVITMKGYVSILRALERRGERMAAKKIVEEVVADWGERRDIKRDGHTSRIEEQFWEVVAMIGGVGWMQGLRQQVYLEAQHKEPVFSGPQEPPRMVR